MRIEPYFLDVIHFEYKKPTIKNDFKTEFLFGHEPGKDEVTKKTSAIKLRITLRIFNPKSEGLVYIAEQSFKFLDDVANLQYTDLDMIIKEMYKQYNAEFNKRVKDAPFELPLVYPNPSEIINILKSLKRL